VATILIVDDDADNRYLLETLLQSHGHATGSARNGAEALQVAYSQNFDLILADILMPVMDGFSLCRVWKQDPRLFRIPFAFYTATYVEAKDEQFALDLGADRFLLKPLPPETILQEVQDLLVRRIPIRPEPGPSVEDSTFTAEYNRVLTRKLEKKLADNERLEARNAQLGKILAASQNDIFVFDDITLRFTFVNQGALEHLGYDETDLRALTPLELWSGFDPEGFSALLQPLRGGVQDKAVFETRLLARDGSSYPVEVHLEPILDGSELSFLAVIQDITERKRQESEHRRLEEEIQHIKNLDSMGRMASSVAHDLNNLLAPILGLAGILRSRYGENPDLKKTLGTILLAAEQGRALVKGLTEFSRKGIQEPGDVDLNALVLETVELLGEDTGPSIQWELDLAEGLPKVQGDPVALSRVLLNLCRNAIDAMSRRGVLRLGTRPGSARWVELAVADSGHGIPPELLVQVMEPFFTTKAPGQGTGLGLSIVNSIIRSHSGTLAIESQEGQGTTIRIQLPSR